MGRDTSFYYSFLVLPPRKRNAIVAVWDFCRAVDDAVDEAPGDREAEARLAVWRDELAACFSDTTHVVPRTSQGRNLQPYIREFRLPRNAFEDLIAGVEMDLARTRYASFDELATYCQHVASAVGLVCVEIFGYRDPASREYAVKLGMALQLTNIIRDVASDLARDRIYLPGEDLSRFSVTEADLRAGVVTPAIYQLLQFECDRARRLYEAAAVVLPKVDRRSLLAAEIMGSIYFEILRRIERADFEVFTSRIRVPRPFRAVLALRLWVRAMLRP